MYTFPKHHFHYHVLGVLAIVWAICFKLDLFQAQALGSFTLEQPTILCVNGIPNVSLMWSPSANSDTYSVQRLLGKKSQSAIGFSDAIMSQLTTTTYIDNRFASDYERGLFSYRIIAYKDMALLYSNIIEIVLPDCTIVENDAFGAIATSTITIYGSSTVNVDVALPVASSTPTSTPPTVTSVITKVVSSISPSSKKNTKKTTQVVATTTTTTTITTKPPPTSVLPTPVATQPQTPPVVVSGFCGASSGQVLASIPTTSLCNTGTPSLVTGTGPWMWVCNGSNGGISPTCTATKSTSPTVQTATQVPVTTKTTTTKPNTLPIGYLELPYFATSSIASGVSISFTGSGDDLEGPITAYEWRESNCSTGTLLATGTTFAKKDFTTGLHYVYFRVKDNQGEWSTNCERRAIIITAPTVITTPVVTPTQIKGTCGTSNSQTLASIPTTNLCIAGIVSTVSGTGPWSWTCAGSNGGTTASCSASKVVASTPAPTAPLAVNGLCGTSNGQTLASAPTASLCTTGTASSVTGSGPYTWSCSGSNGGTTASCSALKTQTTTTNATGKFPSWMKWGATAGWEMNAMDNFVALVGKSPQLDSVFAHWGVDNFPLQYTSRIKDRGRTMVLFWEAVDYRRDYFSQPEYSYDAVVSGSLDTYFTKFAKDAKSYGGEVILIPYSEFNGDWFPWGVTLGNNSPAKFKAAWIHIHDIFLANGVTNVKFGWVPNNDSVPDTAANNFELYYPGSQYVDIVGVDAFNFNNAWETFDTMVGGEIKRLKQYNKPIYIFSIGVADNANKAAWITKSFTVDMYKYPELSGWVWFNESKEEDWRVNSRASTLEAFKAILP